MCGRGRDIFKKYVGDEFDRVEWLMVVKNEG